MAAFRASLFHVSSHSSTETQGRSDFPYAAKFPHNAATPSHVRPSLIQHAKADILPSSEEEECLQSAAALAAASLSEDASLVANNASSQDTIKAESRLFVQTYARSPVVFVEGHGCKLFDAEGKEYLDMSAGIAVNALGHGDQSWVRAVTEQASKLAHVSNLYHSEPQVKLAKRLVESSFADRVFFCNSGTEANEAAIKFARKYQRVKVNENGESQWFKFEKEHSTTEFVAFTNSFHGRTIGALALTSKEKYRAPFEPIMPGVQFVEFGNLEAAQSAIRRGKTAAVFVEPIQGEGGILPAMMAFLKGLRKCCDETGALLVFDEVQCGLGRTGRLWAHEAYEVEPDVLTVAKPLAGGLPIGAVLVKEAVASTIEFGDHGSTFAGGPLVCHAALAVLDRIQEPGFLENVAKHGHLLRSLLCEKLGSNPHVKEVRGTGLLVGVELDVSASPVVKAALEKGLLVLTAGKGNVIRLVPPLIISEQEIRHAVTILLECMPALDQQTLYKFV
ncbi:hypothetical protein GOP47_0027610 [Adiantum capillus-veneris]|nr:hypothetical protein GOP47_0027610 [Adiantum capillus-veneris]